MKTFKELKIISQLDKLILLVEKIQTSNLEGFVYEKEKATDYANMIGLKKNQVVTFLCPEIKGAIASVWMVADKNELRITNITPHNSRQLSIEQYNAILDYFFEIVIKPNIDGNYQVILSSDSKTIEDYAGVQVAKKLRAWITLANKSTLNTHPNDFERWASFVIEAHLKNSKLNTTELEKYLIEEINIPDYELVGKILTDYEYGRDLLKEYDKYK